MSVIPTYAGYGGVVPNYAGNMFPNMPGFTSRPNNMNGNDLRVNVAGPQAVSPWMPPPLPGMGTPGITPNQPAGTPPASPTYVPRPPGMAATLTTPQAAGTPATPAGGATGTTPSPNGGWLSGLLGQITGQAFQPLPAPPNLGLPQQQQNMLAYQTYLQNLANQDNDTRFKQAATALQGSGTTANTEAMNIADQARAGINQDMISKGLNNSTIGSTLNRGVDKDLAFNQQRIQEGIAQQLVNLLQSKNTTGPNTSLFAQLMERLNNVPNTSLIPGFGGGITYTSMGNWSR